MAVHPSGPCWSQTKVGDDPSLPARLHQRLEVALGQSGPWVSSSVSIGRSALRPVLHAPSTIAGCANIQKFREAAAEHRVAQALAHEVIPSLISTLPEILSGDGSRPKRPGTIQLGTAGQQTPSTPGLMDRMNSVSTGKVTTLSRKVVRCVDLSAVPAAA